MVNYNEKLFSLTIICYNHEKYIEDAIQSILTQTYNNIEVVICDDASTDNSWDIIQSFMPELRKRFNRAIAFRNTCNIGLISSLNKVIDIVKGAIVYFMSGDDMLAENYSSDIMHASAEYPEASVFVTDGYRVEEQAKYSELDISLLSPFYIDKPDLSKDTLFDRLFLSNVIFAPGTSVKREVYDKFGKYDVNICIEDLEYWLRISRTKETEFVFIDKKDVFYRKNPNSVSSVVKNEHFIERRRCFLKAEEQIIDKYGIYVERDVYIQRKWKCLLAEREFYLFNIPKEESIIIRKRMIPFVIRNLRVLGVRKLLTWIHMYGVALLKK